MNGNEMHPLDAAIRAHHAAALERTSPHVRAQLAQRRNAALRGDRVRGGRGFRYAAAGFAALGALAIGLQLGDVPPAARPAMPPGIAATPAASAVGATTMLDEDPDFYAWLASSDAQLVAME